MSDQLYIKVTQGNRVRYVPYTAPEVPSAIHNITDRQALTIAASLGGMLLMLFERHFPPHQRNARKIKAVEDAIFNLYAGSGEKLDPEISDWVCRAWDETMMKAQGLPVEGAKNDTRN